jgi:hypothetical protein
MLAVVLPLWVGGRRETIMQTDRENPANPDVLALTAEQRREEAAARRAKRKS